MVKESTGDNKAEREAVVLAINALKARGCDINPYSVAEEANISRSSLVRSSELMRLLHEARSGKNGNSGGVETMEELLSRNETLNHELSQLQWEAGVLRRYFQGAQAENKKLQEELEKTKQEAQNIAKTINIAWQQGYIAGQQSAADAGPIPQKSLVDSLKEAAVAATADSGKVVAEHTAPVAEAPAQEQSAEKVPAATAAAPATAAAQPSGGRPGRTYPQQQAAAAKNDLSSTVPLPPPDPQASLEDTADRPAYAPENEPASGNGTDKTEETFVADVPLHIEDPEVLNDPFTAKLLSALAVGEDEEENKNNMNAEAEVIITPPPGSMPAANANEVRAAAEESDLSYHLDETQPVRALTAADLMEELPAELLAEMAKPVLQPQNSPAPQPAGPEPVPAGVSPLAQPAPAPQPSGQDVCAPLQTPASAPEPAPTPEPAPAQQSAPQPAEKPTAEQPKAQAASPLAEAAADADDEHEDDEDELGDPRIRSRYNADELHNLFRNRFVRGEEPPPEQPTPPPKTLENSQGTKKFVGTKHSSSEPLPTMARVFPPEIRKACRLLGVQPEDLTRAMVLEAWKKEMSKPGVHPDQGGDTEMAIYLNTAKDALLRWVEAQTPKLGKKFGQPKGDHQKPQPQPQPKQE